tara:strand:- start:46 stop:459 length:414 start_codon:yes stop_codon:yes gene_type:complete
MADSNWRKGFKKGFKDWNIMASKWSKGYDEHIPKHVRKVFKENPDAGAVIDTVSAFQSLKAAMGKFKTAYRRFKSYNIKTGPTQYDKDWSKGYSKDYMMKGPFNPLKGQFGERHYGKYSTGTKPQKIKHFPAQRKNN